MDESTKAIGKVVLFVLGLAAAILFLKKTKPGQQISATANKKVFKPMVKAGKKLSNDIKDKANEVTELIKEKYHTGKEETSK